MTGQWCFSCGASNSDEATTCQKCGQPLEEKNLQAQVVEDLRAFRLVRDAGPGTLIAILIAIVVVWLLSGPLLTALLPLEEADPWDSAVRRWVPVGVVLVMFFGAFVPRLVRWLRLRRQHSWSAEQRTTFQRLVRILPAEAFQGAGSTVGTPSSTAQKWVMGCSAAFLVVVVLTVAFVVWVAPSVGGFLNTALQGLAGGNVTGGSTSQENSLGSTGSPGTVTSTPLVAGRYEEFFPGEDQGPVTQTAQTWAYVFFADGTYTTYLEGYQQYSGTWSQSGSRLEVNVPAIAGVTEAYTFVGEVSPSGDSFTVGDTTWERVGDS